MRIIAGEHRGRPLLAPDTSATRPITDRVKQSLFDILSTRLDGATVYDCFAGTGSMGLECLSRGSRSALFFEADRSALDRLARNIATLSAQSRSQVIKGDLFQWFERNTPAEGAVSHPADVIFLDPPYRFLIDQPEPLRRLGDRLACHVAGDGVIVFRHDAKDALSLPALKVIDQRVYGGMMLEFLAPRG